MMTISGTNGENGSNSKIRSGSDNCIAPLVCNINELQPPLFLCVDRVPRPVDEN